jgi:threonine dehydratase
MYQDYLQRILKANVYDVARETPLQVAPNLSRRLDAQVLLKREDLQPVFSFKIRGAYNRISRLTEAERARGVIAASAGNHAQGVALSAAKLGIRAVIVMPKTTPPIKVEAVRQFGAEVVLHGSSFDDARTHMEAMQSESGCMYIPPFDDADVIAGQGTVAMEILRQHTGPLDAIFVPVGGGGLIAGVAAYVKSLWPEVKVIGVEPEETPTLHAALAAGERVTLDSVGIFADGVAVRQIGAKPFAIARDAVDEVVLVNTDEICAAVKDMYQDTRAIAEPSGALAVAGIKRYAADHDITGTTLVAINSGANVNFDRLRHIAERAEIGEHREGLLGVTIPEEKGSFQTFCHAIGHRQVTEFNYRYADVVDAQVFVGLELRDGLADKDALIENLHSQGYPVVDMTDNELAKLHVRHMVGGHASKATDERLYRFEFPERPGALLRFLSRMGARWNISLFHYRNHGAAYGRVLVGMQVPDGEQADFQAFLDEIAYSYVAETDNDAYRLFLN